MVNTLYLSETELRTRGGALDRMLDSLFDNGILLDRDCRILYITAPDQKELIGQHVSVIDQVSPFEAVLRSGRPQLDLLLELHGRQCLSSLFPVSDGEGIIGVVGTITVRSLARLKRVATRISDQDEGFQGLYRGLSRIDSGYNLEDFRGESPVSLQEAAAIMDFINFVGENSYDWAAYGQIPAHKSVLSDERINELPQKFLIDNPDAMIVSDYQYYGAVVDALDTVAYEIPFGRIAPADGLASAQQLVVDNIRNQ